MFDETDSLLNIKSATSNISYKSFKTLPMQTSYCDHRNFDSVNQVLKKEFHIFSSGCVQTIEVINCWQAGLVPYIRGFIQEEFVGGETIDNHWIVIVSSKGLLSKLSNIHCKHCRAWNNNRSPINNQQEIAYDRRKSRVSNLKKAGKVMTADHHDRELWERYSSPEILGSLL
jgi:hypothetical protein